MYIISSLSIGIYISWIVIYVLLFLVSFRWIVIRNFFHCFWIICFSGEPKARLRGIIDFYFLSIDSLLFCLSLSAFLLLHFLIFPNMMEFSSQSLLFGGRPLVFTELGKARFSIETDKHFFKAELMAPIKSWHCWLFWHAMYAEVIFSFISWYIPCKESASHHRFQFRPYLR